MYQIRIGKSATDVNTAKEEADVFSNSASRAYVVIGPKTQPTTMRNQTWYGANVSSLVTVLCSAIFIPAGNPDVQCGAPLAHNLAVFGYKLQNNKVSVLNTRVATWVIGSSK